MFRAGDVDALIHLGVMHDPRARPAELYSWNITGTTKLLEYCQAYRVPKVVLLSSANVYGPRPDNPQFLTEDAPLLAAQRFPADARSRRDRSPGLDVSVARARDRDRDPAAGPHRRPGPQRAVELPPDRAPARCCSASIRWCSSIHVAGRRRGDRARARARAARHLQHRRPRRGAAVGDPRASSAASRDRSHIRWQSRCCRSRSRSGISSFPVAELDFIRYVCMVDGRRAAAELGFRPRFGLRETIRAVDDPV